MVQTNSDGQTDIVTTMSHERRHEHTLNCHCDNYISLTASGLEKNLSADYGKEYMCKVSLHLVKGITRNRSEQTDRFYMRQYFFHDKPFNHKN